MTIFTYPKSGGPEAMIFKFSVRSDYTEDFILNIEADSENTFFQLHEKLQEECKFNPAQLVRFFTADEEWDPVREIEMFSKEENSANDELTYLVLADVVKAEGDHLLYIFDICNDKSLYLELIEINMNKKVNYPVVTVHKGVAPVQMPLSNKEKLPVSKDDPESQHIFEDLGELEDLYKIYGEMSNNIF